MQGREINPYAMVAYAIGVFVDSIFNDLCTHVLAFAILEGSLGEAQKIAEDRAARAADELRQYDVARAVLQAGPTSAARSSEIAQREGAARGAIGLPEEQQIFHAMRSLVAAEARRINHLYF